MKQKTVQNKFLLILLVFIIIFFYTGCIHTQVVYITITKDPQIKIKPESSIVIHNFWVSSSTEELQFRPEKEIAQKFRDYIEESERFKVLHRKSYNQIEMIAKEGLEKNESSIISYIESQNINWQEATKDEPCDYLLLGDTSFEVIDGSGYEYRRIYDPFSRSYKYQEVYVQQKIFNIKIKLILIEVNNNKKIYEDTYNDSHTRVEQETQTNLEEFLFLSEYSIERFLNSFTPEYEKQYRYLLGR